MATITASAAGGNWSDPAAWVGGVVPTITDDVLLTSASGAINVDGTLDVPSMCKSLNCTGYTNTLTVAANTNQLNVAESFILSAAMTFTPWFESRLLFTGSTPGCIIDVAGKTMPLVYMTGAGEWTLAADFPCRLMEITAGTFRTNNFAFTPSVRLAVLGTAPRAIYLGSSTVITGLVNIEDATNLIWDAGTSLIRNNGSGFSIISQGQTFYNAQQVVSISGTGATFNNLFVNRTSGGQVGTLTLSCDITVQNEFQITGYQTGQSNRVWLRSNDPTQRRTITCNGTVSNTRQVNVDGIIGAGTAVWDWSAIVGLSATTGNNSGIIFTPPMTMYWVHSATTTLNILSLNWYTTSGGAVGAGRFPLLQDRGIFDSNSFPATGKIVNMAGDVGALEFTGITNNPQISRTAATTHYGDFILDAGLNLTGSSTITFSAYGNANMVFNGVTTAGINLNAPAGSLTFVDTANISGGMTLTAGTLYSTQPVTTATTFAINKTNAAWVANGPLTFGASINHTAGNLTFNADVSCTAYSSSNSNVRNLTLGNMVFTLTGSGTPWNWSTVTNLTFNAGQSTIKFTNTSASKTMQGGGMTFNKILLPAMPGGAQISLGGPNTFNEIALDPGANIRFPASINTTVNQAPKWYGAAGNLITIGSTNGSINAPLVVPSGLVDCDYLNITRSAGSGAVPFYAGANSIGGNNVNWLFQAAPQTGKVKYFDGTDWVKKPMKSFNGVWNQRRLKHYNGTDYVETN